MAYERTDRKFNEYRNLKMTTGFISSADGSVLIEMGRTRVICNATLLPKVPDWLAGRGTGWITAEYSLLPQSTGKRVERERKGASGRTQEIQRLVGRSLRGAADLAALGENAIVVDCDVIEADGGTRTASIIGGFVALAIALKKIKERLGITQQILKHGITAISVGVVSGKPLCLNGMFPALGIAPGHDIQGRQPAQSQRLASFRQIFGGQRFNQRHRSN